MRSRLVAAAAAVGFSLTAAVVGAPAALAASGVTAASAAPPKPPRVGVFGTECAHLAGTHRQGIRRMAAVPVASAIAATPLLSDLSHAIQVAGLTGPLNSAAGLTVFAPDNSAIADLGDGNWQELLATRPDLVKALKYQIVAGRVTPAELAKGRVLTTLGGTKIYPSPAGTSYEVNNGWVLCGNLKTANATVYVVSEVLIPST